MNHLEKYLDRIIDQPSHRRSIETMPSVPLMPSVEAKPISVESDQKDHEEHAPDILGAMKRRWYVILLVFILFAPVAVYGVWYFVQPGYIVVGRIKVAPAVLDIMTGNETGGNIGNYRDFVATQALIVTSTSVLQQVADDLVNKDLKLFQEGPSDFTKKIDQLLNRETQNMEPADVLHRAVTSGIITAYPRQNTHFIEVSMKSMYPEEATQIVDVIMRNYQSLYDVGANLEGQRNLEALIQEHGIIVKRITEAKAKIRELAQQSGVTPETGSGQEMLYAERLDTILSRSIELESKRIALETEVAIIQQTLDSNSMAVESRPGEREAFINSDAHIIELTRQVVTMEQELLVAREKLAFTNPIIREKENLLAAFKQQLQERAAKRGQEYDMLMADQAGQLKRNKIAAIMTDLTQTKEEEKRYKELLTAEELKSIQQGNTFLVIKDMQFDIDMDMEIRDTLSLRIKQMEMEKNQKPRITIEDRANRDRYEDKRVPYSAGMTMGIFGLGCLLALLIDKSDKRLKEPEDVAKQSNLPLIGTVANARTVKTSKFAEQIASDYQTIRTNLTLLGANGIPKMMCVTSPCPREGKSSFAVNLATSLSKSGERVLLIDGDLRKPDTLRKMNFTSMAEQVSHVPIEGAFEYSIVKVEATGLDILVPEAGNHGDVYELIASPVLAQRIHNLSQKYDHIIIDTPPVLAFPDAMIWARIAGSVILIGFAHKTTINDLLEAKDRLSQINVQLLGTVLNNVKVSHGYQRYHYGYYYNKGGRRDMRMNRKLLMTSRDAKKGTKAKPVKEKTA
ncbi:MAG: polysaccharide biosynthesis tyrosine autokinase [Phycisphaerae bacterium]|nr:polysaccharide biosynthesis tyrosine autokinase [Phycisphaerae bacterium]